MFIFLYNQKMSEVEKEIIIEPSIDDNNDDDDNSSNNDDNNNNKNKNNDNIINIEKKPIKQLTKEEKDIIINNAKNGIENDYYDVKLFKNGNARIVLKKDKPQTISQKYINNNDNDNKNNDNKVYLSNDQLLMEHIIELHSQLNRLQGKQKKLKKKYHNLKNDIYEDIDEQPVINSANNESDNIQQTSNNNTSNNDLNNNNIRLNINNQRGWRSRVSYL